MNDVPPHELAYTIGLITGEGSFFIAIRQDDRYEHGFDLGPRFSISMGQFSQAMLEGQRATYDLGTVNKHSKGYQWIIASREDCFALSDLIDGYVERYDAPEFVLSPKFESYQRWRAALDLFRPGKLMEQDEIHKLARLREEINHLSGARQLSADEVKQLLDENETEDSEIDGGSQKTAGV